MEQFTGKVNSIDRQDELVDIIKNCCEDVQSENPNMPMVCLSTLNLFILETITVKPHILVDSTVIEELIRKYILNRTKVSGLVTRGILTRLQNGTTNPRLTWIKYENLVDTLIKEYLYEPKTLTNEVLTIVKDFDFLNLDLGKRLSAVLGSWVKSCRKVMKSHPPDEEEDEKWCEIMHWISWFIGSDDADF